MNKNRRRNLENKKIENLPGKIQQFDYLWEHNFW